VEVRSKADSGSFEAFRTAMRPAADDRWFGNIRKCRYENGPVSLEAEYSPASQSVRFVMQNDKLMPEPRLFASQEIPGVRMQD
jgi:hypothetical protein